MKKSRTQKLNAKIKELTLERNNLKYQYEAEKRALATQRTNMESNEKDHANRYGVLFREKDTIYREKEQHYAESNRRNQRIARLEKAVTALKEAHQKTLLAFDVLG